MDNYFYIGKLSNGTEVYRKLYSFEVKFSEKVSTVDLAELEKLIRPDPQFTIGPIITLADQQ